MRSVRVNRGPLIVIAILAAGGLGMAAGLGTFTFTYAQGGSYLTDDPAACANCHVMQGHYDAWIKGSHHAVATCNDCHTPHNLFGKYYVKALNGYHHSTAFTFGNFHEPIQITAGNRAVTEAACRHCHAEISFAIEGHAAAGAIDCIRCHADVGHPN